MVSNDEDSKPAGSTPRGSSPDNKASIAERYQKIFEYSNDAIVIVDFADEAFVDVNPAACEMLGYSREELLELDPGDIHPDDIGRVRDQFVSEVLESGSGWTDDMTCITKAGEEVPTEVSGAVIETVDGETSSQMVAILRDISERVERRRELEDKVERLERFAQVLSHDLRNPLTVIGGHLDIARETGDADHFDAMQDAMARMDELIEELLVLTRQGEAIGSQQPIELGTVSEEAWQNVQAPESTLQVETDLVLAADSSRLRELLENLFRNAVQHGDGDVTITIGTAESDDEIGFYVADDGPGIPSSEREEIFQWGHTSDEDGTGYGLAIVDQIAEGHDWEITVTESATGGTKFVFSDVTAV